MKSGLMKSEPLSAAQVDLLKRWIVPRKPGASGRFDSTRTISAGYNGSRAPTLETLRALVDAHSAAISYESIDVLLDRAPKLDLASLQGKMIGHRRGGYCFEQNMLFRGGLRSLGFDLTSLQARVVRGLAIDAPRPMLPSRGA